MNMQDFYLPRKVKVQRAASAATLVLSGNGYEASEHELCQSWINWVGCDSVDVAGLTVEMVKDFQKTVDEGMPL